MNLVTNRVAKVIGRVESGERFLRIALYQVRQHECLDKSLDRAFAIVVDYCQTAVWTADLTRHPATPLFSRACRSAARKCRRDPTPS